MADHPLESRSLPELQALFAQRAALSAQLETELAALQEPSDLAARIEALEGAVELVGCPHEDPREHARLMTALIDDIQESHPVHKYGEHAVRTAHGIHIETADHPVRTAALREVAEQNRLAQSPRGSALNAVLDRQYGTYVQQPEAALASQPVPRSEYYDQDGGFAEAYQHVDGQYASTIFAYTTQGRRYPTTENRGWHQAGRCIAQLDDGIARVPAGMQRGAMGRQALQVSRDVNAATMGWVPKLQQALGDGKQAARKTCPYGHELAKFYTHEDGFLCGNCKRSFKKYTKMHGCAPCAYHVCPHCIGEAKDKSLYGDSDIFIDRHNARAVTRVLQWQMAHAGIPVYGDAPAVTREWLDDAIQQVHGEVSTTTLPSARSMPQQAALPPRGYQQASFGAPAPAAQWPSQGYQLSGSASAAQWPSQGYQLPGSAPKAVYL